MVFYYPPTSLCDFDEATIFALQKLLERFPSGQREQTVNLPAIAFGGSNPPLSTGRVSGPSN